MGYKLIKKIISAALLIPLVSICSSSCIKGPLLGCSKASTNSSVPIKTLLEYPDNLEIDGNKFKLSLSISRVSYSNTASAIIKNDECPSAGFSISSSNEKYIYIPLPDNYKYEYVWIINDKEVWETKLENNGKRVIAGRDTSISGGPDWKTASAIAIVRIKDDKGKIYFIKSNYTGVIYSI